MREARVTAEEQYKLIMECRASGLSDHQWCLNNDIKPGTFYNWVIRLRKRAAMRFQRLQDEPVKNLQIV